LEKVRVMFADSSLFASPTSPDNSNSTDPAAQPVDPAANTREIKNNSSQPLQPDVSGPYRLLEPTAGPILDVDDLKMRV
jgi:hypothetical protein